MATCRDISGFVSEYELHTFFFLIHSYSANSNHRLVVAQQEMVLMSNRVVAIPEQEQKQYLVLREYIRMSGIADRQ